MRNKNIVKFESCPFNISYNGYSLDIYTNSDGTALLKPTKNGNPLTKRSWKRFESNESALNYCEEAEGINEVSKLVVILARLSVSNFKEVF